MTACNNKQPSPEVQVAPASTITDSSEVPAKDNLITSPAAMDSVPSNIQIDTLIHIDFPKDSTQLSIRGSLNKDADPVTCYLPVDVKKNLDARLLPEDAGLNIRFSQIILPDGESDGPFGKQLKYKLDQQGTYKIIIGPNRMASGKKSGDFVLKIAIRGR